MPYHSIMPQQTRTVQCGTVQVIAPEGAGEEQPTDQGGDTGLNVEPVGEGEGIDRQQLALGAAVVGVGLLAARSRES